jgi:hypothetical protein
LNVWFASGANWFCVFDTFSSSDTKLLPPDLTDVVELLAETSNSWPRATAEHSVTPTRTRNRQRSRGCIGETPR